MTIQTRKQAPDLDKMFFDEVAVTSASRKAELRQARKTLKTEKKTRLGGGPLIPKNAKQRELLAQLNSKDMVIALGSAGGGKTYVGMRWAIQAVLDGEFARIVVTRPMVEVGQPMGFLPGGVKGRNSKVGPWMIPLMDVVDDVLGKDQADRWVNDGVLEFAPIAYMRGRTLGDAVIVLDEAQNCSGLEIKTILTRVGENTKVIVNGDPRQKDRAGESGLVMVTRMARNMPCVGIVEFEPKDIVRSELCRMWVEAFEAEEDGGVA